MKLGRSCRNRFEVLILLALNLRITGLRFTASMIAQISIKTLERVVGTKTVFKSLISMIEHNLAHVEVLKWQLVAKKSNQFEFVLWACKLSFKQNA